jgi:C4-dicarboxylate transporter DctM subunit
MSTIVVVFFGLLLLGFPIAFVMLAVCMFACLAILNINPTAVIQQAYSGLNSFTILAVPFFIISGNIAANGGTASSLINVMRKLFGKLPGGLGICAVAASAFFAAITGSSMACIVAVGAMMLPHMAEEKYPEEMAIGIVNSAGALGILIPPSIPMVSLSVVMGVSVADTFAAGLIPGLLLALVWCLYIGFICRKKGIPLPEFRQKSYEYSFKDFVKDLPAVLYPVIILGSIYGGIATPTEAAAISIAYIVFLELFYYKSLKFKALPAIFGKGVVDAAAMSVLMGFATPMTWASSNLGLPAIVSEFAQNHIPNRFVFILIFFVIMIVLGCFIQTTPLVIVMAPILLPTLVNLGIPAVHFGIMTIFCSMIGMLTPPFGFNLFTTMRITGKGMGFVSKATVPYLIILVIVSLLISFFPQITMFLPNLLKA